MTRSDRMSDVHPPTQDARDKPRAQDSANPAVPGGRKPDSAMCEDKDHPGRIDKSNDC